MFQMYIPGINLSITDITEGLFQSKPLGAVCSPERIFDLLFVACSWRTFVSEVTTYIFAVRSSNFLQAKGSCSSYSCTHYTSLTQF